MEYLHRTVVFSLATTLLILMVMAVAVQQSSALGSRKNTLDSDEFSRFRTTTRHHDKTAAASQGEDTRIVGGGLAAAGEAPYQVSMRIKKHNFHFCGGSIINETWILTAAHCTTSFEADEIEVVTGTLSLTEGGDRYDVARIISHELYNPAIIRNDIALLQVSREIQFGENVQQIALSDRYVDGGEDMLLTGWGMTSYPGNVSKELKRIDLKSISNIECIMRHFVELTPPVSFSRNICTLTQEGEGACKGDSGGPLVEKQGGQLAGVVSWGVPCARGAPDIFTRVYSFLDWIGRNMGTGSNSTLPATP